MWNVKLKENFSSFNVLMISDITTIQWRIQNFFLRTEGDEENEWWVDEKKIDIRFSSGVRKFYVYTSQIYHHFRFSRRQIYFEYFQNHKEFHCKKLWNADNQKLKNPFTKILLLLWEISAYKKNWNNRWTRERVWPGFASSYWNNCVNFFHHHHHHCHHRDVEGTEIIFVPPHTYMRNVKTFNYFSLEEVDVKRREK